MRRSRQLSREGAVFSGSLSLAPEESGSRYGGGPFLLELSLLAKTPQKTSMVRGSL